MPKTPRAPSCPDARGMPHHYRSGQASPLVCKGDPRQQGDEGECVLAHRTESKLTQKGASQVLKNRDSGPAAE